MTATRVLEAIRRTPRAAFVPAVCVTWAYDDAPIPIPHHQVTTQPSLSAAMIAALGLTGTEEVLEVGTGYGYQTAPPAQDQGGAWSSRSALGAQNMSFCTRRSRTA